MKTAVKAVAAEATPAANAEVRPLYLEALTLVERLHRRLLDVIKDEFERRGRDDVNSVQALLLYNIGDKELTASELRTRGYYLGSNVSYNVKKLVEMGYLHHARSRVDRRSVRISLTERARRCTRSSRPLREARPHHRADRRHHRRRLQAPQPGADPPRALLDGPDPLPALRPGLQSYLELRARCGSAASGSSLCARSPAQGRGATSRARNGAAPQKRRTAHGWLTLSRLCASWRPGGCAAP